MPFRPHVEEELEGKISIDDYLIQNRDASFILKVSDRSMVHVGIMPGDLIIVERGREPKNRDIAVLFVDGEYKMVFFDKFVNQTKPEDFDHGRLEAVVTGLARSYGKIK